MEDDTSLAQSFRQRLAAERVPAMLVEACYDDENGDDIGGGGGGGGGSGGGSGGSIFPELILGMRVRVSGLTSGAAAPLNGRIGKLGVRSGEERWTVHLEQVGRFMCIAIGRFRYIVSRAERRRFACNSVWAFNLLPLSRAER